jgi:hypothetical protein
VARPAPKKGKAGKSGVDGAVALAVIVALLVVGKGASLNGAKTTLEAAPVTIPEVRFPTFNVRLKAITIPDITVILDKSTTTAAPDPASTAVTIPTEPVPATDEPTTTTIAATTTATAVVVPMVPVDPCLTPWLAPSTVERAVWARGALDTLVVAKEVRTGYQRDLFKHWVDVEGDGFDGRQQALGTQSFSDDTPVANDYTVLAGVWCSAYDGKVFVNNPGDLDIDHSIPLAEAWDSGASAWTSEQRRQFANDNTHTAGAGGLQLIPVTAAENRAKGDRDPSQWMPSKEDVRCAYAANWVEVKQTWALSVDESEAGYLRVALDTCAAGGIPKRPGG